MDAILSDLTELPIAEQLRQQAQHVSPGDTGSLDTQAALYIEELEAELTRYEAPHYVCGACGYHPHNRYAWCALGCGSDYNQMFKVALTALDKEKE
jgi:hypothetical protein